MSFNSSVGRVEQRETRHNDSNQRLDIARAKDAWRVSRVLA
jgi:hypothetical protein